ncbi:MAG: HAMP domain-containing protein [Alphaproteobacteria bacterium]|nr:HAMP domain-containing protein [Alphaproteobacteria bacterium]OJV13710.1 MAG: hypothetical protein BGO27_00880 [Alphaproteobacteria bacterium 33-17]
MKASAFLDFFNKVSFRKRVVIIIYSVFLISGGATYLISDFVTARSVKESQVNLLKTTLRNKAVVLNDYFKSIVDDISITADENHFDDLSRDLIDGFNSIPNNPGDYIRNLYRTKNPYEIADYMMLNDAKDGSKYSEMHSKYMPWLRRFVKEKGYYDLFIFDTKGNLVFTVAKEDDYGSSFAKGGKYFDTGLGNIYNLVRDANKKDFIAFSDFEKYKPSFMVPASFVAKGIFDESGKLIGVLALQMPINKINEVINDSDVNTNIESYLVGKDFLNRNQSKTSKKDNILTVNLQSESVKLALSGKSGVVQEVIGGSKYIVSFTPINFLDTRLALIEKIKYEDAMAQLYDERHKMIMALIITSFISLFIAVYFGSSITKPINDIAKSMKNILDGSYDISVPHIERQDEIGKMAGFIERFREQSMKKVELERAQLQLQSQSDNIRSQTMHKIADDLEQKVNSIVQELYSSSGNVKNTSEVLCNSAEKSENDIINLLDTTTKLVRNIKNVESVTGKIFDVIFGNKTQILESAMIAKNAVEAANNANVTVSDLSETAAKIGSVIELINEITAQINLLALNATIEAARAGEAGKGFAVVASEVKNLANQTTKATEEIADIINTMQGKTMGTVDAMKEITRIIEKISNISLVVVNGVGEEEKLINEIKSNTTDSSKGTTQVMKTVNNVAESFSSISNGSTNLLKTSTQLKEETQALSGAVSRFIENIKNS